MSSILNGKNIILGITGSIAAYKAPMIVRELIKAGAAVKIVMTPAATKFVSPLSLQSVSRNAVAVEMFSDHQQSGGAWHVELAQWADLMIIAPCSAATLSKIATGNSETALVCVAMAMPKEKPLLIAPAMDFDMWLYPATQNNAKLLGSYGAEIIPPEDGELASGLSGPGRLPDISVLMKHIEKALSGAKNVVAFEIISEKPYSPFDSALESIDQSVTKDNWNAEMELEKLKNKLTGKSSKVLEGKHVMITAGPTVERIDDVRFLSNHSTGKMGYALAKAAKESGAEVVLISGPVALTAQEGIRVVKVESAEEMYSATVKEFAGADLAILSAAVADFTPAEKITGKLKKETLGDTYEIKMVRTKDILAELGRVKTEKQVLIGFALESENEIENAKKKLHSKNCDAIVANSANKPDSGFGGDTNTITIIDKSGNEKSYMPMSKELAAVEIIRLAGQML